MGQTEGIEVPAARTRASSAKGKGKINVIHSGKMLGGSNPPNRKPKLIPETGPRALKNVPA
jgi:hypothetical protein